MIGLSVNTELVLFTLALASQLYNNHKHLIENDWKYLKKTNNNKKELHNLD